MGYILDFLLVLIFVASVIDGTRRGFFKSLMSLITGVLALLLAFTLTPTMSAYVSDNFVLDGMTEGIESTFYSIARTEDEDGEEEYDLEVLSESNQFIDMMDEVGVSEKQIDEVLERDNVDAKAQISRFARMVAEPMAKAVSDIISFIIIFVVSLIVLKILTIVVGLIFKLPVLKSFDRILGVVFGVLSGLFLVFVFAMVAETLSGAIADASPSSFTTDIMEESLILGFVAEYNPLKALFSLFG